LRKAFEIYRVTPSVLNRPVLCLLDQKVKAQPFTGAKLFLRILPLVPDHPHVNDGPENLLPPALFGDEFYEKTRRLQGAKKVAMEELKKVEFARHVCEVLREPAHFERFRPILDEFRMLLVPPAPASPVVAEPEAVQ
jgi:hypothetical protein